jgi:iron complex transport system substrate-binding protein
MKWKNNGWTLALSMIAAISLSGCDKKPAADVNQGAQKLATPIMVKHELGTTSIAYHPQRAAVLDMNEADFLDQLSIPIAGIMLSARVQPLFFHFMCIQAPVELK